MKFITTEKAPAGFARDGGVHVHPFLIQFNETFQKSGIKILQSYLKEFESVTKWLMVSDYAFYDKNKVHDVVTFSLIPYIVEFDHLTKVLNGLAPADLKKTRTVNPKFLTLLADGPLFNITIKLDRCRKLHSDERAYHKDRIQMLISQLTYWIDTTPQAAPRYRRLISALRKLETIVTGSGGNLKTIRDIEIVSLLTAYLMCEVTRSTQVDTIGWFSDRDALLNYKNAKLGHFMHEMVDLYYYLFCENEKVLSQGKLILGLPGDDNKVWYDTLVRIPDLLAGTLADYDYEKNVSTHNKFIPIIEKVFVSESRNLFFKIDFGADGQAGRLTWKAALDGTEENS